MQSTVIAELDNRQNETQMLPLESVQERPLQEDNAIVDAIAQMLIEDGSRYEKNQNKQHNARITHTIGRMAILIGAIFATKVADEMRSTDQRVVTLESENAQIKFMVIKRDLDEITKSLILLDESRSIPRAEELFIWTYQTVVLQRKLEKLLSEKNRELHIDHDDIRNAESQIRHIMNVIDAYHKNALANEQSLPGNGTIDT